MIPSSRGAPRRLPGVLLLAVLAGCGAKDRRDIHAANTERAVVPNGIVAESWPVCGLIGPQSGKPGVFGTDLGITVHEPVTGPGDRLAILFGDTWADEDGDCRFPRLESDDLTAWLPAERPPSLKPGPPSAIGPTGCGLLEFAVRADSNAASWQPIRLYENLQDAKDGKPLETGMLKTPLAAFSDGQNVFAMYGRNEPAFCGTTSECPSGLECTTDPSYRGRRLGVCARDRAPQPGAAPTWCRDSSDCTAGLDCQVSNKGTCVAPVPFHVETPSGRVSPPWYTNDPRLGVARTLYVAARLSVDRPTQYVTVHHFVTHKFIGMTTRTVKHFDENDPSKNDYTPGNETLLVWGRPLWFGSDGAQSLPFLLHVPLAGLSHGEFRPRFFAGYDPHANGGKPRWSDSEGDAEPVYGAEGTLAADGKRIEWTEPEFDYVNQVSLSWVAPLRRWLMVYGGDLPAFMLKDPRTRKVIEPTYLERSPGALHFRTSPHPWGRREATLPREEGWSSAEPLLTRRSAARYMACGEGGKSTMPGCLEDPDAAREKSASPKCALGEMAYAAQIGLSGNPIGRLYAANVIDEWTDDVTAKVGGLAPGERAVEIYFNASTWNPYQVVLFKAQLRGKP